MLFMLIVKASKNRPNPELNGAMDRFNKELVKAEDVRVMVINRKEYAV
ncbi:hypothetical protein [Sutcliffiella horikoshii]